MNNVTAKDLRDAIEVYWDAPYYEDEDDRLNREGRRDAELAAFDTMAKKAEAFDKLELLIEKEGSGIKKIYEEVLIHSSGTRSTKQLIGRGKTLAEALKAVPE